MTEQELKVMDNENCVLFIRGEYPFFCTKYPLEQHPNYSLSGDSKDKYKFHVKSEVFTGINRPPIEEKDAYTRLFEECQQADTRDSDREHRYHTRPMEKVSARGRRLGEPMPLMDAAKEFVREKAPKKPDHMTDEDVSKMVNESLTPEPNINSEGGSELIESMLSSYSSFLDYCAEDDSDLGIVANADNQKSEEVNRTEGGSKT